MEKLDQEESTLKQEVEQEISLPDVVTLHNSEATTVAPFIPDQILAGDFWRRLLKWIVESLKPADIYALVDLENASDAGMARVIIPQGLTNEVTIKSVNPA